MTSLAGRRRRAAVAAVVLALGLTALPAVAVAQDGTDAAAIAPGSAPEPLWVPDPEDVAASTSDSDAAGTDPLQAATVDVGAPAVLAPVADPVTDEMRIAIAHWMARGVQDAGLPAELPVMAALVESGLRNLPFGDRDSVGFFQMRQGIWDRGAYAGYLARPELQLRWFADHAIAVRDARRAAGDESFGEDPAEWGEWIAAVERPAAQYRGRYGLRLAEARALLATPAPPVAPFAVGLAVGAPAVVPAPIDPSAQAVLEDANIVLSPIAQEDVAGGRVDPRLTNALLEAAKVAPIAVSVFQTGHSYLTVNGSVSNHSYGRAADVSTVGDAAVTRSNQDAKRLALALSRLPEAIRPTEIGTPWAIDDPAYFTDHMHQDHLHVGFDTTAGDVALVSSAAPATGSVQTVSAT
ncbi:MAG: hypothetical protein Q8K79_21810, partial [Solirubrobacteraceae bacterium]|nr:hypothetical protein [Solirubrobacteraceae bacterium]